MKKILCLIMMTFGMGYAEEEQFLPYEPVYIPQIEFLSFSEDFLTISKIGYLIKPSIEDIKNGKTEKSWTIQPCKIYIHFY